MAKDDYTKLSGLEKSSIILMAISPENATKVFSMMDDDEIREISQVMSSLGTIRPEIVERIMSDFSNDIADTTSFVGNIDSTEKLLLKVLGKERVDVIMEDIRGPAGKSTWEKLGNVNEDILAAYLKNEYPQTVALIVSRINPAHAAKVLSILPDDFAFEVMTRMLNMDSVKKEVLDQIERTLRAEFISNLTKTQKYESDELIAEVFNNFDRTNETKFMTMLEQSAPEAAEKIKSLMFTFDDLIKVDPVGIQAILRNIDKSKLALALKGSSTEVRNLFLNNMSQRASKILQEDMSSMGPVRLRDVDEAQVEIIAKTKELIASGEVTISESGGADELIY